MSIGVFRRKSARASHPYSVSRDKREGNGEVYIALLYTRISCKGWNVTSTVNSMYILLYKKHIDASVKERPQTLLVPSEQSCKRVLCNKHI